MENHLPDNVVSLPEPHEKMRIIRGRIPLDHEKEAKERDNYDSGYAEKEVATIPGPYEEPWLNAIAKHEPASIPGFEMMLKIPEIRSRIRGKVLDVGAGTCWLSAKLSRLPDVGMAYPLDLSERFMTTVGIRLMKHFNVIEDKITFIASDFNEIPLPSESLDCAVFFAALHHSLAPVKTLQEVGRCLKKGGAMIIFETPPAAIHIRKSRKQSMELSEKVTEYTHTREELEYIIDFAKVGKRKTITLDVLSRGGWRIVIRKIFRKLRLEHILLNPPTYVFLVIK